MTATKRPVLGLSRRSADAIDDDRIIEVATIDALLPCRQFRISYKVAEFGRVSMTAEFALRLLKAIDGLDEASFGAFFGFDNRELSFVLHELVSHDFIERIDGRLWLTAVGRGLFQGGAEEPAIFQVEKRTNELFGFDLLSLAPLDRDSVGRFEWALPELGASDPGQLASVTERLPGAFRRFYSEIASKRDADSLEKRELYSIDEVAPAARFAQVVAISAKARASTPSRPEPDLSSWHTGRELEDRLAVAQSAARLLDQLCIGTTNENHDAYAALADFAPDLMQDFIRRDGVSVDRYYKEVLTRVAEFQKNRRTVPVVGTLFSRENSRRLLEALGNAMDDERAPKACVWLVPRIPYWGATRVLPATLAALAKRAGYRDGEDEESFDSVALVAGRAPRHISEAFERTSEQIDARRTPGALECCLLPGSCVAVLVHAPLRTDFGVPVGLGFVSFDKEVVGRVTEYLMKRLRPSHEVGAVGGSLEDLLRPPAGSTS